MIWRRSIYSYIGQRLFLTLAGKYKFLGIANNSSYKYLNGPTDGFAKYMSINYTIKSSYSSKKKVHAGG